MTNADLHCPKCNARVYATDLTCMECGAPLRSQPHTPIATPAAPAPQPGVTWLVSTPDGKQWGPYTREALQDYVNQGSILVSWQATDGVVTTNVSGVLAQPAATPQKSSSYDGIIPYKNPRALIAYYLGVFSIIPGLGIAAFILGIQGLGYLKQHPEAKGAVHAWIGIIVGGLFGFGYLVLVVLAFILPALEG